MDYKQMIESLSNIEAVAFGYRVNGKVCGMDCSDFEQIIVDAVDAITDLLARAESAEARAEKAERERVAAIKQLKCAYDAIDKLSNMIDSRIHPNVDCYRYMSRMENLDAILAWDAKSNDVD